MGLQYGFDVDTYVALWPNGQYYINNQSGLKAMDVSKCKIEGTKITYTLFLKFNNNFDNPQEAITKLTSVGLNSVPTWTKPYCVLSNGEKFRADLARRIKDNAVIDEFKSVSKEPIDDNLMLEEINKLPVEEDLKISESDLFSLIDAMYEKDDENGND